MKAYNQKYRVFYSEEDNAFVAYLQDMPSLSVYAQTRDGALEELKDLVNYCDLEDSASKSSATSAQTKIKAENKERLVFA